MYKSRSLTGRPDTLGSRSKEVLGPDQQSEQGWQDFGAASLHTLVPREKQPADPRTLPPLFLVEVPSSSDSLISLPLLAGMSRTQDQLDHVAVART